MADREKVIKWFEFCRVYCDCSTECPYFDNKGSTECAKNLASDVMSLLKEQAEEIENLKQTAQSMIEGIVISVPRENPCSSCQEFNCDLCGWKKYRN